MRAARQQEGFQLSARAFSPHYEVALAQNTDRKNLEEFERFLCSKGDHVLYVILQSGVLTVQILQEVACAFI